MKLPSESSNEHYLNISNRNTFKRPNIVLKNVTKKKMKGPTATERIWPISLSTLIVKLYYSFAYFL